MFIVTIKSYYNPFGNNGEYYKTPSFNTVFGVYNSRIEAENEVFKYFCSNGTDKYEEVYDCEKEFENFPWYMKSGDEIVFKFVGYSDSEDEYPDGAYGYYFIEITEYRL